MILKESIFSILDLMMAQKNFSGFLYHAFNLWCSCCHWARSNEKPQWFDQFSPDQKTVCSADHLIRGAVKMKDTVAPPLIWSPLGQFSEGRRMSQEKVFRELLTFHPASVWSFQLELGVQQRANHLRLHSLVSEAALMVKVHLVIGGMEE